MTVNVSKLYWGLPTILRVKRYGLFKNPKITSHRQTVSSWCGAVSSLVHKGFASAQYVITMVMMYCSARYRFTTVGLKTCKSNEAFSNLKLHCVINTMTLNCHRIFAETFEFGIGAGCRPDVKNLSSNSDEHYWVVLRRHTMKTGLEIKACLSNYVRKKGGLYVLIHALTSTVV